jgi:tRNA U34 5-methylaminomethyl-2-thiouridine-forming methyltransferase MnmC
VGSWAIELVTTNDGTHTLYSAQFDQHYHSVKEGALNESLSKHIIPALQYHKNKKELTILDICFGIGYNSFATLYYIQTHKLDIKVNIYSPEFDLDLLHSIKDFTFPKEFESLQSIIQEISENLYYEDNRCRIEIYNGDAREYLNILYNQNILFDIVYQDAFSSEVNRLLWTQEYFAQIKSVLNNNAIITTYSIATPIRLSIYNNDINIYEYKPENSNRITLGLNKKEIDTNYKYIDMQLKQQRNKTALSLKDKD